MENTDLVKECKKNPGRTLLPEGRKAMILDFLFQSPESSCKLY